MFYEILKIRLDIDEFLCYTDTITGVPCGMHAPERIGK